MNKEIRIQKWISELGIASRRQAEKWLQNGYIKVNGTVVKELGTKVDPQNDSIMIKGMLAPKAPPPKMYWMFNKPDLTLVSRANEDGKPTIYDLPALKKVPFLFFTVGRLDFRTEGLLLLSNDGDFVHKLTHPKFKIPRHYQVLLSEKLTKEQLEALKNGIKLEDGPVSQLKVKYVHSTNLGASTGAWYYVTVWEGRNRLVRRIFEHFDKKVVKLIRVGFGEIRLPESLASGSYRQLTVDEVNSLKNSI